MVQSLPSSSLGNRILRAETGRGIQAQSAGERPEFGSQTGRGSLTYRNCESFYRPGNRVGLPGLDGGRCRDRTCDPSRVKGVPRSLFLFADASESDRGDNRDQPTEKDAIVEIPTNQLSRCGSGAGCDPASLLAWAPRLGMSLPSKRLERLVVIRSRSFVARRRVLLAPRFRAIASGFSGRARRARSLSLPLSRNRPASLRSV